MRFKPAGSRTMNTPACRAEALSPINPMAQWWRALAARWAAHREAMRHAREFDFAADLSADTLRDIGAPEQLISQAKLRHESQQQRLLALRQWRDG
jgi:hypothetical protein